MGWKVVSSDGRLKAESMSARLANLLCTGRIMIGADVTCWSISNSLLVSFDACDSFLFASYSSIFVSPSSLFTRRREYPSMSTSRLSRSGIAAPLGSIPSLLPVRIIDRLRNIKKGLPLTLPLFDLHFVSDQLRQTLPLSDLHFVSDQLRTRT